MDDGNVLSDGAAIPLSALSILPDAKIAAKPGMILPEPTYTPPDRTKKSHARKQPAGHIPRPRNAFILFRSDFVRQKKIPNSVEKDHRNISRIVGKIWKEMTDEDKQPWIVMAEEEKAHHSVMYPAYRFTPGFLHRRKAKRGDDIPHEIQEEPLSLDFWQSSDLDAFPRHSSCPPGDFHVPQANADYCNGFGAPLKTRDDLSRRPSRVILYRTAPHPPEDDPLKIQDFHDVLAAELSKRLAEGNFPPMNKEGMDGEMPKEQTIDSGDKFCGPRLFADDVFGLGTEDSSGWEEAQRSAVDWTHWGMLHPEGTHPAKHESGDETTPPVFTNPFPTSMTHALPPLPRGPFAPQFFLDPFGNIRPPLIDPCVPHRTTLYSPLESWPIEPQTQISLNERKYLTPSNLPADHNMCHSRPGRSSFSRMPDDFLEALGGKPNIPRPTPAVDIKQESPVVGVTWSLEPDDFDYKHPPASHL